MQLRRKKAKFDPCTKIFCFVFFLVTLVTAIDFFSPRQRKRRNSGKKREEEGEEEVFLGGGELQLCPHPVRGVAHQLQTPLLGLLLRLRPPFSVRE